VKYYTIKLVENFCHLDGATVEEAGLLKCSWKIKDHCGKNQLLKASMKIHVYLFHMFYICTC